ncbi:hypothetical protein H009_05878 [Agrobacterium tumefaciens str. Cherry 2E-2-2]|nr:hypothetical protein H009_05878 [Agrobacterium tumefaciens str. Cherry 2E-2-2]
MNDGNKESTKEMLAVFRIIASAGLSLILLLVTFKNRTPDLSNWLVYPAALFFSASLLFCLYLFLQAITLLAGEADAIIDQPRIKVPAMAAMGLFMAGVVSLLTALMCI